jgi:hypothetical protein
MKIAFLGDLHGRVFHALALVVAWQATMAEPLDLVIQVGDMGASWEHLHEKHLPDEKAPKSATGSKCIDSLDRFPLALI